MSPLAIVFPGQGSQSVGMLSDIAAEYPIVKETFNEASSCLDYDLWKLTQEGPATELDKTEYTQPALLTAGYAVWRLLQAEMQLSPAFLAGHSLGEYTALLCANAFSFSDAVRLVALRGKYMQEAVKPGDGAMAALIGLDENTVKKICEQAVSSATDILSPANFNSMGQIVVAGHRAPVERAVALAKEQGAKLAMLIPVSVPSHCLLMQPAAVRLKAALAAIPIQKPQFPILNNVDVMIYDNEQQIREGLVKQLYLPVRWVEIIQYLAQSGVKSVIECGPGKILTGLNKRIDKQLELIATTDKASINALLLKGTDHVR